MRENYLKPKHQCISVLLKLWKILILFLLFSPLSLLAQDVTRNVRGVIYDESGDPLPGATVMIEGSTRGVSADIDGTYTINVKPTDKLIFSFIGMESQTITVGAQTVIDTHLKPKSNELDEVTIVGFGRQKKESVIASISTVKPAELKVPSSNLTSGLAGRMAGVISYQTSGEPGKDNTNFFIRGVTTFGYSSSPLILIDNIESTMDNLARLSVDDIAAFSIMKDATATAIYGARGANGVILVTTKEGVEGKVKLSVRVENSISTPVRQIKTVDPITYMKMYNEAVITRTPNQGAAFTQEKINGTAMGNDPYFYPAVNWYDELFKKVVANQRVNANISGGGGVAKYFVSVSFSNDNGALKVDGKNNYNNNINIKRIQVRSNTNINLTKTTGLNVRVNANFEDYNGPIDGGNVMYRKVRAASPVHFAKTYLPDDALAFTEHVLYGSYLENGKLYVNPYADMTKGYRDSNTNDVTAQLELTQDLKFITEGLRFRVMSNASRYALSSFVRSTSPFYYNLAYYDPDSKRFQLQLLNEGQGQEDLNYTVPQNTPEVVSSYYFEGMLNYERSFEKHTVGALIVGTMNSSLRAVGNGNPAPTIQQSLASRNMGISGRITYAYDSKYLFEGNFGYNGSERFAKKERFGFFPSLGVGYIISNDSFWSENKYVNKLKIKTTYGLVGNDRIGDLNDRFFYIPQVNLNGGNSSIVFGENFGSPLATVQMVRYGNDEISWEVAKKLDVGAEMTLFNFLELQTSYFQEKRSNIYQVRPTIPEEMGFGQSLSANVGRASSYGFEVQADANKAFGSDFWLGLRGNFTFARSNYDYAEEIPHPYPWLGETGFPIKQMKGYVAERLFIDGADIINSPQQMFTGGAMPGDIKYRDINGDDVIDKNDIVPLGYTNVPEILYGFGFSLGYKNIDISCFFQGAARSSFYIDALRTTPFLDASTFPNDGNIFGGKAPNNVLQCWADSYWSEDNRNNYAAQPRLTTTQVDNNIQASTWWMRNGSYLRLKSVEIGYTFPEKWQKTMRMSNLRIYASGLNLLTFSRFKEWDAELGGNGFNYPIQAVYNLGLNLNF